MYQILKTRRELAELDEAEMREAAAALSTVREREREKERERERE
eukprot:SAG31_NODE_6053_length_2190_cov_3.450024_1_plen_44_part_00